MKRVMGFLCAAVALALLPGLTIAEGDDVTMSGSFVWEREDKNIDGDLRAVFTPTGEATWDVSFHFDWDDGPHVYTGTATGNLSTGSVEGEVENDNEERKATFRFRGEIKEGTLEGTHVVIESDGGERPTGSFTLSRG